MHLLVLLSPNRNEGGSVAEWLACWTQAQNAWVQIAARTLSGNSPRQTVHTHHASVHQAAKWYWGYPVPVPQLPPRPLKGCGGNCGPGGN